MGGPYGSDVGFALMVIVLAAIGLLITAIVERWFL